MCVPLLTPLPQLWARPGRSRACGIMEGCVALGVSLLHICMGLQQQLDDGNLVEANSHPQRRDAFAVLAVDVCAVRQQLPGSFQITRLGCVLQRLYGPLHSNRRDAQLSSGNWESNSLSS